LLFGALEDVEPLELVALEFVEVDEEEEEVDPEHGREDMMSWMLLESN